MNDAERRQLVNDLTALSDTVWSAIPEAQGDRLQQLLELANESEAALRELQSESRQSAGQTSQRSASASTYHAVVSKSAI